MNEVFKLFGNIKGGPKSTAIGVCLAIFGAYNLMHEGNDNDAQNYGLIIAGTYLSVVKDEKECEE